MYTFLRLDTRTGMLWEVQWSMEDDNRFVYSLSDTAQAPMGKKAGRFTLYPTTNMYNFVLLDQDEGRTWQVQWSTEKEKRLIAPILDILPMTAPATETVIARPNAPASHGRPKKPEFGEPGHDNENWNQFEVRQDAYLEALVEYRARQILAERAKATPAKAAVKPPATTPKK